MKNLLIIAAVFCLPLVLPDLVFANIPSEYRQRSHHAPKKKSIKSVIGWMTHYYGPERGQRKYKHGSYKKEVRNCGTGKETASGTKPQAGKTISVNSDVFPYGSVLRITNLKTGKSFIGIAEDTGQTMQEFDDGSWIDRFTGHGDEGLTATFVGGKQPVLIELLQLPKKHKKKVLVASR